MSGRMRVIAGEARGLGLVAPPGVRPTAGRVREALFSSLGDLTGASVLDLYAGSGALAIEALSRGADRAVLVEQDRAAAAACRQNLATTGFDDRAQVVARPVASVLAGAPPGAAPFDLVCCDPPYERPVADLHEVLAGLTGPGWLGSDARVVVERPARARRSDPAGSEDTGWAAPWKVGWERKYGDTLVTVLTSSSAT
jgi:16S rRNA (guanine966-N2)-methyltransferase